MPKGKKICPDCGIENGVRTTLCRCGHRFSPKSKKADAVYTESPSKENSVKSKIEEPNDRRIVPQRLFSSISCPLIQTPAGRCPIKPEGFTRRDWPDGPADESIVADWAFKVFASGNYLPQAVAYWANDFWDMNSNREDHRRVTEIVLRTLSGDCQETL